MDENDTKRPQQAMAVFRDDLSKMSAQLQSALPQHMPVERFVRVLLTAVQQNDQLLNCDRRSLWNACMRAAQDGLLPDGREGAIVPYQGKAQWLPMVGGIRKKARNSGEIATWDVHAVHERDAFEFELGDEPFIRHKPCLDGDPGALVAVYSTCTMKSGEKSRDVMSRFAVDRIRKMSKTQRADSPWNTHYDEMAKKTVAKRHAKVLPTSADLDDLIRRDDDIYEFGKDKELPAAERAKGLTSRLAALASGSAPPAIADRTEVDEKTGEVIDVAPPVDAKAETVDTNTAPLRARSAGAEPEAASAPADGAPARSSPTAAAPPQPKKAEPKRAEPKTPKTADLAPAAWTEDECVDYGYRMANEGKTLEEAQAIMPAASEMRRQLIAEGWNAANAAAS